MGNGRHRVVGNGHRHLLPRVCSRPNLRRPTPNHWMAIVRSVLWGAAFPKAQPKSPALAVYGGITWIFYVVFLDVMYLRLCQWLGARWGFVGLAGATYHAFILVKRI